MTLQINQNFNPIFPQFTCPIYPLLNADLRARISALAAPLIHIGENRDLQLQFEREFTRVFSKDDEAQLIDFVLANKHFNRMSALPDLLYTSNITFSPRNLRMLFRKFKPKLTSPQLQHLIEKYGTEIIGPLSIRSLKYSNTNTSDDFNLFVKLFRAMQTNKLSKNDFLQFWHVHKKSFKDLENLKVGIRSVFNFPIDLLKWMKTQGCNLPYDSDSVKTYIRRGDRAFIQAIAQELPKHLIQDGFSQTKLQTCLENSPPVSLDQFDFKPVAIGEIECRTIIFTDQGEVHSFIGQDPKALLAQIPDGKNRESFQIVLAPHHASIGFKEGTYYGLSTAEGMNFNIREHEKIVKVGVKNLGKEGFGIRNSLKLGKPLKSLKPIFKPYYAAQSAASMLSPPVPCKVYDDSKHVHVYSNYGLHLTVHASKKAVETVRKYVEETKNLCDSGDIFYHYYSNNCVRFIEKAMKAAGIQADYRDAFEATDLSKFLFIATLYTLLTSSGPIIHPSKVNTSLIDRLPRKEIRDISLAIPTGLISYLTLKSIPHTVKTILRITSRVQQISMAVIFGLAAASG